MILFLSKLIPALIFPAGLTILLCLISAWLAFRQRAVAAGVVSLCAAALLYAAASPLVSNRLMLGLEKRNPPSLENPRAAAIVLLGGGMSTLTSPRVYPETNAAGDRLLHAARLWKQGKAPALVATGGYIPFLTNASGSEAALYAALLTELFGVPGPAVLTVPDTKTTADDAEHCARLFAEKNLKKEILLVTSAAHMLRAAALFRKQGFTVHPAPTDFHAEETAGFKLFNVLPSGGALAETGTALHEYLGLWAYKMLKRL